MDNYFFSRDSLSSLNSYEEPNRLVALLRVIMIVVLLSILNGLGQFYIGIPLWIIPIAFSIGLIYLSYSKVQRVKVNLLIKLIFGLIWSLQGLCALLLYLIIVSNSNIDNIPIMVIRYIDYLVNKPFQQINVIMLTVILFGVGTLFGNSLLNSFDIRRKVSAKELALMDYIEIGMFLLMLYFLSDPITELFLSLQLIFFSKANSIFSTSGTLTYKLCALIIITMISMIYSLVFHKLEMKSKLAYGILLIICMSSLTWMFYSVTLFNTDKIVTYSIINPKGKVYRYEDIKKVRLGISSGRKIGIILRYNLVMKDKNIINLAGDPSKFYDGLLIEEYIDRNVPHLIYKSDYEEFLEEGIPLPDNFQDVFKIEE